MIITLHTYLFLGGFCEKNNAVAISFFSVHYALYGERGRGNYHMRDTRNKRT